MFVGGFLGLSGGEEVLASGRVAFGRVASQGVMPHKGGGSEVRRP